MTTRHLNHVCSMYCTETEHCNIAWFSAAAANEERIVGDLTFVCAQLGLTFICWEWATEAPQQTPEEAARWYGIGLWLDGKRSFVDPAPLRDDDKAVLYWFQTS